MLENFLLHYGREVLLDHQVPGFNTIDSTPIIQFIESFPDLLFLSDKLDHNKLEKFNEDLGNNDNTNSV